MSSPQKRKIFITGLPNNFKKKDIERYFSAFGLIKGTSTFFRIGARKTRSLVLECETEETKELILSKVHKLKDRFIHCTEYLRGKRLKSAIESYKNTTIFMKFENKLFAQKVILETELTKFGKLKRIKIGFNYRKNHYYAIASFEFQKSAENLLNRGFIEINNKSIQVTAYRQREIEETQQPSGLGRSEIKEKALKGPKSKRSRIYNHFLNLPEDSNFSVRPKNFFQNNPQFGSQEFAQIGISNEQNLELSELDKVFSQKNSLLKIFLVSKFFIEENHYDSNLRIGGNEQNPRNKILNERCFRENTNEFGNQIRMRKARVEVERSLPSRASQITWN
jgi:RNA recognition motif-containing protein